MSDFSKLPLDVLRDSQDKGYTGIHIEQGVPILDRDLNLLHDLLDSRMRSMFSRYIGNGIPSGPVDGFAIHALPDAQNTNNFQITGPGTCLVGGTEVTIAASTDYNNQPNAALLPGGPTPLTAPSPDQPDPRTDTVYLDVFLREIDGTPDLDNRDDVGIQTSVRIKAVWIVRVAENAQAPPTPPEDGHRYYPLARLLRRRGEAKITEGPLAEDRPELRITDLRQQRLTVAALESRLTLLEKALVAPSFKSGAGEISPRVGPVGIPVTLSGKNFDKLTITVKFGDVVVPSTGFVPLNANENPATVLRVKVPPGVTTEGVPKDVHITVSNEIGSDVSDRVFQVLPRPVFVEGNQFSPTTGPPGTLVTLFGFNFTPGQPTVTFDSKNATVQPDATYTQLRVLVPDGIAPNTDVAITVSFPTRGPNMAATTTQKFKVTSS